MSNLLALPADNNATLNTFGHDPIWLVIIKVVAVFVFLVVMTLFSIVFERKVVGRMQNRIGPNRTGPWGILQSLADGVKLAFKEEIIPVLADKPVYWIARCCRLFRHSSPSRWCRSARPCRSFITTPRCS